MSSNVRAGGAFVEIFVKDRMRQGLKMAQQRLQAFAGMASRIAGAVGGISAGAIAGWGVKLAADAETAQVGFEVMLGSAEAAKQMVADLQAFADRTPLEFSSLQDAARTLLNFGVSGDQIMPMLQMLGDVSGGDAEKLQRLALAFGQASGKGRLMGQEVLQMVEAGFNPLQFIAARTGETMLQLTKRMEKGGVSIAEVQQAFIDATGPGGRFFGMLDKMGLTLAGRWSTLKDSAAALAREIGTSVAPVLKTVVDALIPVLNWTTEAAKTMPGTFRVIAIAVLAVGGAMIFLAGAALVLSPVITAVSATISAMAVVLPVIGAVLVALASPLGILVVSVLALNAALAAGMAYWAFFTNSGRVAMFGLWQVVSKTLGGIFNAIAGGDWKLAWDIAWGAALIAFHSFYADFIAVWEGFKTFLVSTIMSAMQGVLSIIRNTVLMAVDAANAVGANLDRSRIENAFGAGNTAMQAFTAERAKAGQEAIATQEALNRALQRQQDMRLGRAAGQAMDIGDAYWSAYNERKKFTLPGISIPSMIGGGTGTAGTFSGAIAGMLGRMGTTDVARQQLDATKETNEKLDEINQTIGDAQLAWG